jgi:hypothetical protein
MYHFAPSLLPLADRFCVHRVTALDVEGVTVALGAPQLIRVGAGIEIGRLQALGLLHDGAARGRADLADDDDCLVLLDQLLRLGHGDAGVDAVLGDEFELAAEHATAGVDLLHCHLRGVLAIDAKLAEEASEGGEVPDLYDVGLGPRDRREAHDAQCRRAGSGLEHAAARQRLDRLHAFPPLIDRPAWLGL